MKKTIQLLLCFTLIIFNSCGSSDAEEVIEESIITVNTSTNSVSFSDTEVSTTTALTFNVTNTGNANISGASITNSNNVFSISPSTFSLAENESKTFTVSFTPSQNQEYTDTFSLTSGSVILASLNVNGKGIITTPITSIDSNKSSLNYADVSVNTTKQLSIVISNTGNQNIELVTVSNNSSIFKVNPTSFSLSTKATKTILIDFTPTQAQTYNDVITFTVNNNTMVNLNVSGNGVASAPLTTYSKNIQPIMTKYCTSCHGNSGGLSVENYTQTKFAFTSRGALQEIESGRMPQTTNKVSQSEINLIKEWIKDDYAQ